MYDPQAVFTVIRNDWLPIFAFLTIAMIGNTLYFVESIRLGFRDRSYAQSALCTIFFLAHDLSFILNYQRWFVEYDFWVWKAIWVNIVISVVGEMLVLYQMIRYARDDVLPGFSTPAATIAIMGAVAGSFVAFSYVLQLIGDPLYLMTQPFTIFWLAPFAIALTLKRKSRRGQSVLLNATYIMMVLGMWPAWWQLGIDFFKTPVFMALGAVTILWSLANIWVLLRQPAFDPSTALPVSPSRTNQDHTKKMKAVQP